MAGDGADLGSAVEGQVTASALMAGLFRKRGLPASLFDFRNKV